MKINYTMWGLSRAGGSSVLVNIMNRLVERGHDVTATFPGESIDYSLLKAKVITPHDYRTKIDSLVSRRMDVLYKTNILKKKPYSDFYDRINSLKRNIPECDINVATFCFTAFSVFRSGKGIPFYHMQHYEELFFSDAHLKALARETYHLPLNKIANSIWLRDQIKEKFGQDVPIVNPGINLDIFRPKKSKELKSFRKRVVCYGSNVEWKGFKDAVEAMKIVFKERKDIEWTVFGLSPLKEYSNEAPYSFVQGIFDEELAQLYSSADVVFCPSWYESFPLPPIEAMACSAPMVTTRFGTEDYCFHEENSLVVPPKEPKLMAQAIVRLLEDRSLANRLSENGLRTAKEFTWNRTIDKVETLFKQALEGKV